MFSFAKSFGCKMFLTLLAFAMTLVALASTAEARCCHRKHRIAKFVGRLLMVMLCFGIAFATAAPALAGGFGHRSVIVQRQVIRQPIIRQRVVVQQQIVAQPLVYAQPIVAQSFYAQPIVQQQVFAPMAYYSQPLVSQQFVQPSCAASQQFLAPQQFRQSIGGGGCSSFFQAR